MPRALVARARALAGLPVAVAVAALALALALVACTGSHPPAASSKPAVSGPGTSSSSSAPSSGTSATGTSAPGPLSKFESDPAVQTIRAWTRASAHAVNGGHLYNAASRRFMTTTLSKNMHIIDAEDIGLYYPGPVPFTPLAVRHVNAAKTKVPVCFVGHGFAQNRKTGKPAAEPSVFATIVTVVKVGGRWQVAALGHAPGVSCTGVNIPEPSF